MRYVKQSSALVVLALLLIGCPNASDPTRIVLFEASPSSLARGEEVTLRWEVTNAGSRAGVPSCSISRRVEGEAADEPTPVACSSSLSEVPPAGPSATYVRYQLNALKAAYDASDPYLTSLVTVTIERAAGVSVSVMPASVTLPVNGSQEFTASVSGATDPSVTWSASCGSVPSTGNPVTYVAPATEGSCSVTATSVADVGATASATVTVTPEPPVVRVSPTSATLLAEASQVFTASVTGALDTRVTWDASCGWFWSTENPATYVAPAAEGTCTVTATSTADARASGEASVTVLAPGAEAWTRQFGTDAFDYANAVAIDGSDGVLVAGYTWGSLAGANAGGTDAFVRKLDGSGNTLWTRQFGTGSADQARGVAVGGDGSVVVAGDTGGSLGGANAGSSDAFVRKLDAAGNVLWTRQFGTASYEYTHGVAVDGSGNVLVAGYTGGSLAGASAGSSDAFVRKLDAAGNELWTRQFGTSEADDAYGVAVDASGNVLVAGTTRGSLSGALAGSSDVFVRKLDPAGATLWTRQFGTSEVDVAWGVATDRSGNVLVVGYTEGELDGASAGAYDAFVRKLDGSGNTLWTRQFGTEGYDHARAVAADASDGVLVTGYTDGSMAGTNAGMDDVFVRKFDSMGNESWTRQVGTVSYDIPEGLAISGTGALVVAGHTGGLLAGASAGGTDAFVLKMAP